MNTKPTFKLVYQSAATAADERDTTFERSLNAIVETSKELRLVSPYLSVEVLENLTNQRDFWLITDLDACGVGDELKDFLYRHKDRIRSVRGVHAKVVLGDNSALLGSANLTRNGLCRRFEMACEIHDGEQLEELRAWFDDLWKRGAKAIDGERIEQARERTSRSKAAEQDPIEIEQLPKTGTVTWLESRTSKGPHHDSDLPSDIEELAGQLGSLTRSANEARRILERFNEVFEWLESAESDLSPEEDPRIHMNFGGSKAISITVGQRYVVWVDRKEGRREFGMLLDNFDVAERWVEARDDVRCDAFTVNREPDVPSFYWPIDDIENLPQDVIRSWRGGIEDQFERSNASSYRESKRPSLYGIVRDPAKRARVVELAYREPSA